MNINDASDIFIGFEGDKLLSDNVVLQTVKDITHLNSISSAPINLHIMPCYGGDWELCMAIYDAILSSKSPIVTISYGVASSAGSIIPQAAHTRFIMPHAYFLLHWGTFAIPETSLSDVKKQFDYYDGQAQAMIDIYLQRCKNAPYWNGQSENEIENFLKNELDKNTDWCLTAEEAVKFGFMDGVYNGDIG